MGYTVKIPPSAEKDLAKIDHVARVEIIEYMLGHVQSLGNPRSEGKPLKGKWKGLWRYRVGDYRVICDIIDRDITIMVVEIGHRGRVYK